MSLGHGNKIVTSGLVFAYDMHLNDTWVNKSYKGKPTVNYAWSQNPRVDTSYTSYVATTSGTWTSKHPKAIQVYNKAGSQITGYINSGVTDWTNTYHAVWEYDSELNRPVVVMRDIGNGSWMAKNFSLGKTYAQMGLTNGDTYTISWLQWVNDLNQAANAGVYGTNTSSTNGFHDGLARTYATAYNTKTYTWQRVYATFTIAATNNLTTNRSCYMYGHYGGRGITKIADVQIEAGAPSTFIAENSEANSTRSNTQAILDWTGNNTVTASSLTYNSDGTFSFNGSSNYVQISKPLSGGVSTPFTLMAWAKSSTLSGWQTVLGTNGTYRQIGFNGSNFYWGGNGGGGNLFVTGGSGLSTNTWYHLAFTFDGTTGYGYLNGTQTTGNIGSNGGTIGINMLSAYSGGGGEYLNGSIGAAYIYDRALTATEVRQNFNALRGRYGL